jgi:transposase-like protein
MIDLTNESSCYEALVRLLHPEGLACPRCHSREGLGIHRRHRSPVLDFQCGACGRVFNAWTATPLEKTHRNPSQILRLLEGIRLGKPTAQLARELGCQRAQLLALRRRLEPLALVLSWDRLGKGLDQDKPATPSDSPPPSEPSAPPPLDQGSECR